MTKSNDQADIDDSVDRALRIAFLAVAVAALAGFAYWLQFRGRPFGDVGDWGVFGDFIGGLVNPAVGIATAILVVFNLKISRIEAHRTRMQLDEQLAHLRREHTLAEMLKRLDGAMDEWRRLMGRPIRRLVIYNGTSLTEVATWPTLGDAIESETFRNRAIDTLASGHASSEAKKSWEPIFNDARHLLHEVAAYCNAYEVAAGNRVVADFYRRRMADGVQTLDAMDLLPITIKRALDIMGLDVRELPRVDAGESTSNGVRLTYPR